MDDLKNVTNETLTNYFNYLSKVGYVKDVSLNQIVLLDFLDDFVHNYSDYLYEEDYILIGKILNCLKNNSCFINYSSCNFNILPEQDN